MGSVRCSYSGSVIPGRRVQAQLEASGSLWPNGEFSVGYAPGGGLEATECIADEYGTGGDFPLDLAMLPNSHSDLEEVGVRRGQGGLTSHGARMVRNCAEAMEGVFGAQNLTFATMTLPEMEYEDFWNVSSNWAEIVRVFYQRLGRFLEECGGSKAYCSVTELQPGRTRREGIPALHLHFIFQGRPRAGGNWFVRPDRARRYWADAVHLYCRRRYDFTHSENLQQVRDTAAGYLSKYMSKGGDLSSPIPDNPMGWTLPTSWCNISLKLKQYVKGRTYTSPEMMELVESMWRSGLLGEACDYFYEGVIEECVGPGPHFCIGRMKEGVFEDLKEIYRAQQLTGG